MNFNRITVESDKLEDKPTIRGLPITVETVCGLSRPPRTSTSTASESWRELPDR